jgi:hypothetical protein
MILRMKGLNDFGPTSLVVLNLSTPYGLKGQVIPAQGNALGIRAVTPFGLKGQLKNLILCSSMMSRITGNLTWPYRP